MPAFCLRALLLGLLLLSPLAAQAELTLGWIPGAAVLGRQDQARQLAAHLQFHLDQPVELRAFADEDQLHQWLQRYRMVDLAPLSLDYLQRLPPGQLLPVANLSTASAAAQLVVRQGLASEQQLQLRTLLANTPDDPAGRAFLASLGAPPAPAPPGEPPLTGDGSGPPLEPAATPQDEPPVLPGDVTLTNTHAYLSRNIEQLSDKIDAFFGTQRAFEESSGTYVQLRGSLIYQKYGDVDFDGNVRAKLDLPNLKKKLALVFESESEETLDSRGQITTGAPSVAETFDNQQASASLQYIVREERFWDLRLQPGIKLHWPPETFLRLRMRRTQPLSEKWLSRVILTPGWYDPRGWEVRLRHDFDRAAGGGSLFRASSEAVWLVKEDRNLGLVQSFAYSHPLGNRVQMAYQTGVTFETDPTFWDTAYFSSIRYRRNIHRGWVFLELKPQILFEREQDFKADASFAVSLEILFGARSMALPPPRPTKVASSWSFYWPTTAGLARGIWPDSPQQP